jgi:uncharacterized BrkB/YihY/UPF0761 family membrane protein
MPNLNPIDWFGVTGTIIIIIGSIFLISLNRIKQNEEENQFFTRLWNLVINNRIRWYKYLLLLIGVPIVLVCYIVIPPKKNNRTTIAHGF